jgi:hypothetical protein
MTKISLSDTPSEGPDVKASVPALIKRKLEDPVAGVRFPAGFALEFVESTCTLDITTGRA